MDLDATHLSSFLNTLVFNSTKRYNIDDITVEPRYKTLFYKMVSTLVCTLLRFVSLMVAYGLLLSRLFVNKLDLVYTL